MSPWATSNAPHNNTPMLGVLAHGALIRVDVKWLNYCSCPVNPDVIQLAMKDKLNA